MVVVMVVGGGGWWSDSILDLVPLDKTRRTWGGWDYVVSFLFLFLFFFVFAAFFLPSAAGNEKDVLTYYRVLLL